MKRSVLDLENLSGRKRNGLRKKKDQMSSYTYFNPNSSKRNVGDCAVRAVAAALDMTWEQAYTALCLEGYERKDMPHANNTWGAYLQKHGFVKHNLPNSCIDGYAVGDFARDCPVGTYVLALSDHVVCVKESRIMDTWDSSDMVVLYYFAKEM